MADHDPNDDAKRLHWGGLTFEWDGADSYVVTIPAFIDPWETRWLDRELSARLRAVADVGDVTVEVIAATRTRQRNRVGYDAPGAISIAGLRPPWPDVGEFRDALGGAVADAYVAAAAASEQARTFRDRLREAKG